MGKIVRKSSQVTLVLVTTLLSISLALLIVFIGYKVMDDQIRKTEIIMTIIAPLVISSTVTWYLYGLIKGWRVLSRN